MNQKNQVLRIFGTFIHSKSLQNGVEILKDHVIDINKTNGSIISIFPKTKLKKFENNKNIDSEIHLKDEQFLIPGFIDTHTHAPQFVNSGLGQDLPLMKWLEKYTFPVETKFKNQNFAEKVYDKVVDSYLSNGTTLASYFGTIHTDSDIILSELCKKKGQRALVGKVSMDRNSPDFYIEKSTQSALKEVERFVDSINSDSNLVKPIITPRFVPTCTPELLEGLGEIADKYKLSIQSHINENLDEISFVESLHPECKHYLDVYEKYNCLKTNKKNHQSTIMGHAIFNKKEELEIMKNKNITVAHCPLSNFVLKSGTMEIKKMLKMGIKVSLGTDNSGGYSTSMLNCLRNVAICSNAVYFNDRNEKDHLEPLNMNELFYLATLGGAEGLNLDDVTGNFEIGKQFDALVVDLNAKGSRVHPFTNTLEKKYETDEDYYLELLQRFLFCGDDRNITSVFVSGKKVIEKQ